jgi:DNA repair protein RadC
VKTETADKHELTLIIFRRTLLPMALAERQEIGDSLPQTNASALIARHNHPSGRAEPSESDRLLTRDLIAACHPIGVKVLDPVIVAGDEHYSFADTGLLDELGLEMLAPVPTKDE